MKLCVTWRELIQAQLANDFVPGTTVCFGLIVLKNSSLIAGQVADSLSVLREAEFDDGTEAGSASGAVL